MARSYSRITRGAFSDTVEITLEELGRGDLVCLEVELEYDAEPGEERTWDYPGSPAYIELTGARVTSFEDGDLYIERSERPDWFELLDRIAMEAAEADETYTEMIAEQLDEREAAESY